MLPFRLDLIPITPLNSDKLISQSIFESSGNEWIWNNRRVPCVTYGMCQSRSVLNFFQNFKFKASRFMITEMWGNYVKNKVNTHYNQVIIYKLSFRVHEFLALFIATVWFKKAVKIYSSETVLWIVTVFLNQTLNSI